MAKHLISSLTLLVLAMAADGAAQDLPAIPPEDMADEAAEEIRYYSVEVIVFEYTDTSGAGNEIFDPEPVEVPAPHAEPIDGDVPMYTDGTMTSRTPVADDATRESPDALPDIVDAGDATEEIPDSDAIEIEQVPSLEGIGFRLLQPEEMSLHEVHEKLLRLDAYQPLLWGGWIQAAVDQDTTLPVKLRRLGAPPLTLSGELTMYLKNYLHVGLRLGLEHQIATIEPIYRQQQSTYGDRRQPKAFGDKYDYAVRERQVIRYVIEEDRIFNSGHLRYFDHPRFGALVFVDRFELPETEDAEDADVDPNAPGLNAG